MCTGEQVNMIFQRRVYIYIYIYEQACVVGVLQGTETEFWALVCNFDDDDDDDNDEDNDRRVLSGWEALSDVCRSWDFEQK